jgi:hypothetical protein
MKLRKRMMPAAWVILFPLVLIYIVCAGVVEFIDWLTGNDHV